MARTCEGCGLEVPKKHLIIEVNELHKLHFCDEECKKRLTANEAYDLWNMHEIYHIINSKKPSDKLKNAVMRGISQFNKKLLRQYLLMEKQKLISLLGKKGIQKTETRLKYICKVIESDMERFKPKATAEGIQAAKGGSNIHDDGVCGTTIRKKRDIRKYL